MAGLLRSVGALCRQRSALWTSLSVRSFYSSANKPPSEPRKGFTLDKKFQRLNNQLLGGGAAQSWELADKEPMDRTLIKDADQSSNYLNWSALGFSLGNRHAQGLDKDQMTFLRRVYSQGVQEARMDPNWARRIRNSMAIVSQLHLRIQPGVDTSQSKLHTTIFKFFKFLNVLTWIILILYLADVVGVFSIWDFLAGEPDSGLGAEDRDDMGMGKAIQVLKDQNKEDEPVEHPDTRFDDVKGIKEIRQQLEQVADYLVNRERYEAIGAHPPKGILLSGPPGCGKTLLGRALAGECGVPFYFVASSSIDGMYVGTGVKRLKNIFKAARKHEEGAIIFLDEIDAIGGKRTKGDQVNPYSRMTINKLLAEMDGFDTDDKVIVVASTNLPEVMDKALTRSGRFDQHIQVPRPMKEERMEIMNHYLEKVSCVPDIDVEKFCGILAGAVGADIATIVNTGAHFAAKKGKDAMDNEDLSDAIKKQLFGTEQTSKLQSIPDRDIKIAAYHEAGKALLSHLLGCKSKLVTTTIIPRNGKLGVSKYIDLEYTDNKLRDDYLHDLSRIFAGAEAENIATTELFGAKNEALATREDDFKKAKRLAVQMVGQWGMGEGEAKLMFHVHDGSSEYLRKLVEHEAQRLIKEQTKIAQKMLHTNKRLLQTLAESLLRYETMTGKEVLEIINTGDIESVAHMREIEKQRLDALSEERKQAMLVDLDRGGEEGGEQS